MSDHRPPPRPAGQWLLADPVHGQASHARRLAEQGRRQRRRDARWPAPIPACSTAFTPTHRHRHHRPGRRRARRGRRQGTVLATAARSWYASGARRSARCRFAPRPRFRKCRHASRRPMARSTRSRSWATASNLSSTASTRTPRSPTPGTAATPQDTPHAELAEVTEADLQAYLELVAERPRASSASKRVYTNGHGARDAGERRTARGRPVDVDARLEAMRFGGAGENAIHPTQLSRHGVAAARRRGLRRDGRDRARGHQGASRRLRARGTGTKERARPRAHGRDLHLQEPRAAASACRQGCARPSSRSIGQGREPYLCLPPDRGWQVAAGAAWATGGLAARAAPGGGPAGEGRQRRRHRPRARDFLPIEALPFEPLRPGHACRPRVALRRPLPARHRHRHGRPRRRRQVIADLVELIAMCTGRPLLGEQPVMRCKAWYHNAEDAENEIYRRIAAICQHYDIDQDELEGWLFVTSGINMPIKIAVSGAGDGAHRQGHDRRHHPHHHRQRDPGRQLRPAGARITPPSRTPPATWTW